MPSVYAHIKKVFITCHKEGKKIRNCYAKTFSNMLTNVKYFYFNKCPKLAQIFVLMVVCLQMFFEDNIDDAKYCGHLYGLGTSYVMNGNATLEEASPIPTTSTS